MKLKSVKKMLGTIGAFVFYAICIIAVFQDAKLIEVIAWPLLWFVCTLFLIKTAGGVAITKITKDAIKKDEKK